MTNKIILKKSSVSNRQPAITDLEYGELALNYADGKLYYKSTSNQIKAFSQASTSSLQTVTDSGSQTTNSIVVGGLTIGEITFPNLDGTPGQVLATDGSGNLTFVDQSSGGSTLVGDSMLFNVISRSGEVAIKLTALLQTFLEYDNQTYRNPFGAVDTRTQTITVTG